MTESPPLPGGDLEYAVLNVLWASGPVSARAIYAQIGHPRGLVYTTIATVLDRLHAKGLVSRRKVGQAFTYTAAMPRERVERARADHTLRHLFGDEPLPAIARLVEAIEDIDPALMRELTRQVAARRKTRHGS